MVVQMGSILRLGLAVAASTEGNLVALDNVDAIESFVFPGQPSKKFATDAPSMLVKADEYYVELVKLRTLHAILCNALGIQEDYFYQNLIIPMKMLVIP